VTEDWMKDLGQNEKDFSNAAQELRNINFVFDKTLVDIKNIHEHTAAIAEDYRRNAQ